MKKRLALEFLIIFTALVSIVALIILLLVLKQLDAIESQPPKTETIEVTKTIYVEVPVAPELQKQELNNGIESDSNLIIEESNSIIPYTDDELDLLARVIMSEASVCDIDIKYCIGQTVVNRVLSENFPDTIAEVVFEENQYSTADNGEPNADCYKAAEWALTYQFLPTNTYYFRTDRYHDFGTPLVKMGNVYFSTN